MPDIVFLTLCSLQLLKSAQEHSIATTEFQQHLKDTLKSIITSFTKKMN